MTKQALNHWQATEQADMKDTILISPKGGYEPIAFMMGRNRYAHSEIIAAAPETLMELLDMAELALNSCTELADAYRDMDDERESKRVMRKANRAQKIYDKTCKAIAKARGEA